MLGNQVLKHLKYLNRYLKVFLSSAGGALCRLPLSSAKGFREVIQVVWLPCNRDSVASGGQAPQSEAARTRPPPIK